MSIVGKTHNKFSFDTNVKDRFKNIDLEDKVATYEPLHDLDVISLNVKFMTELMFLNNLLEYFVTNYFQYILDIWTKNEIIYVNLNPGTLQSSYSLFQYENPSSTNPFISSIQKMNNVNVIPNYNHNTNIV